MLRRLILCMVSVVLIVLNITSCAESDTDLKDAAVDEQTQSESTINHEITDELREDFFEISRTMRLDKLPEEFNEETKPLFTYMKWYLYYFDNSKNVHSDNGKQYISGQDFEELSNKYFGVSYDLSDTDNIYFENVEYIGPPFVMLKKYSEKVIEDSKKEITIDLYDYSEDFQMFFLNEELQKNHTMRSFDGEINTYIAELMKEYNYTYYEACRHMIITGDTSKLKDPTNIYVITYITSDGITPDRFIKAVRHSAYEPGKYTGDYDYIK